MRSLLRVITASLIAVPTAALAQIYNGPGIGAGVSAVMSIPGLVQGTLPGVFTTVLGRVTSYLGLAALITITVAGIYLLLGFGDDGSKDKAKKIIIYTIAGMAIVILAELIVSFAMYLVTGTGEDAGPTIIAIMNRIVSYTALIAFITIVVAGFYLILGLGDDGGKDKAKKIILYTIIGIILIGFANVIVSLIYYVVAGTGNGGAVRNIIAGFIRRVLNYLGLIATITIIIAGFYLVLSLGNDDNKDRAKKIVLYTVIGLVVILLSRIIVEFVLTLL